MAARILSFETAVLVVKGRRRLRREISYREILTAERLAAPRRGIRLHLSEGASLVIACRGKRLWLEAEFRSRGVRVVDCWGCIVAPTLAEFERELLSPPIRMRQSSDSG